MKSVTVLYGMKGTVNGISLFTIIHIITASLFLMQLGLIAQSCIIIAFLLLIIANCMVMKEKTPDAGLKALLIFHLTMLIYAVSIIVECAF